MQVSTAMLADDLEGLLEETQNLVGEVKFGLEPPGGYNVENCDPVVLREKKD